MKPASGISSAVHFSRFSMARRMSSWRAFMSVMVDSKECLLRSEDKAVRIWGWLSWSIHHTCLSCHFRHWRDFVFPVEKVLKTVS